MKVPRDAVPAEVVGGNMCSADTFDTNKKGILKRERERVHACVCVCGHVCACAGESCQACTQAMPSEFVCVFVCVSLRGCV